MSQDQTHYSHPITLGKLISKLSILPDKTLPIVFDNTDLYPTGLTSYRGLYHDLAINYSKQVAALVYADEDDEKKWEYYKYYGNYVDISERPRVIDFLNLLETVEGKYLQGYKGGDYKMHKDVSVWIANYGETCGYLGYAVATGENDFVFSMAVVDIAYDEKAKHICIITKLMDS